MSNNLNKKTKPRIKNKNLENLSKMEYFTCAALSSLALSFIPLLVSSSLYLGPLFSSDPEKVESAKYFVGLAAGLFSAPIFFGSLLYQIVEYFDKTPPDKN